MEGKPFLLQPTTDETESFVNIVEIIYHITNSSIQFEKHLFLLQLMCHFLVCFVVAHFPVRYIK